MKKNYYVYLLLIIVSFIFGNVEVLATNDTNSISNITFDAMKPDDFSTNCQDFAGVIRMGGYLLFLAKVLLPIIIIVKSSLNVYSLIAKGNPEEFKKLSQKFMTSIIAAIIIFFIPTIINVVFNSISRYTDNITEDSEVCAACIFEPFSNTCNDHIN